MSSFLVFSLNHFKENHRKFHFFAVFVISATIGLLLNLSVILPIGHAQIIPPSPIGLFMMDEGSGTITANYAGSRISGTLVNNSTWVSGLLGQGFALRFNGATQQINITDPSFSNMNNITLSAWIYPFDNNGTLANSRIISKSNNPTISRFALSVGSDASSIVFSAGHTTAEGSWKTPANGILPLRVWHHVVVTYDFGSTSNNPSIYIDGALQTLTELTTPAGNPVTDDSNLYFGSMGFNNSRFYGGFLDQVRIYNQTLSPSETQALIASSAPINVSAVGSPEIIFDWSTQRCEVEDTPDAPARAFRDSTGRVNLFATHVQNYRMTGPSLNSVTRDCNRIMASSLDPVLANANHSEWLVAPYTLDGQTVHSLIHAEWYPHLVDNRCLQYQEGTITALTLAVSTDRGATYTSPADYKVWQSPVAWDTSFACTSSYGGWNPSNIVRMGNHYYSLLYL